MTSIPPAAARPLAAVDIGSNSFRLEIGQLQQGRYRRLDYLKETVRLGAGLDANGFLTDESAERGLKCLRGFATRLAGQYGLPVPELSADTRAMLRSHPWPGNVRELRNAIERALVLSPPGTMELGELESRRSTAPPGEAALPFPATLKAITQAAAMGMLELVNGNKSEAARRLGISRPRLQRILDGQTEDE